MNLNKIDYRAHEHEDIVKSYRGLEMSTVVQGARVFTKMPLDLRACREAVTRLLCVIARGDKLSPNDATEVFFSSTRLFQTHDPVLRRMVYMLIKALVGLANDIIIVHQSLMKDMNGTNDLYRGPAIRALAAIIDTSMLQGVERHLKQAIISPEPSISSAALVSSLQLMRKGGSADIVKRWVGEVNETLNAKSPLVQYHGLALLYAIKKHDPRAVVKLLSLTIGNGMRSNFGNVLLLRLSSSALASGQSEVVYDKIRSYIEGQLRNKDEMVCYEAARTMCRMKDVSAKFLGPAISHLQGFLRSTRPLLKFAAMRTLNEVANRFPTVVSICNPDMETLINDSNRSVATLAISTLLKTGAEDSVERLMTQIQTFIKDIPDGFKIVVVDAVRALCLKFPSKQAIMVNFLSAILKPAGGTYEYKRDILTTIISIIHAVPEAQEGCLEHLCDVIEDCEFTEIITSILHLLGTLGPKTAHPSKYVRFIYNRIVLENPVVRAAAVTSLTKFAIDCPDLVASVKVLLARSLYDSDDEVRDRVILSLSMLENRQVAATLLANATVFDVQSLETALLVYKEGPSDVPFNLAAVPVVSVEKAMAAPKTKKEERKERDQQMIINDDKMKQKKELRVDHAAVLAQVERFKQFGPLFKSSEPQMMTEKELEYLVKCTKHVFAKYVVLQFDIDNTLRDQVLEKVVVELDVNEADGFKVVDSVVCDEVKVDAPGVAYVALARRDPGVLDGTFGVNLKFTVKDCDSDTGIVDEGDGFEEEYPVEDVSMDLSNFMLPVPVNFGPTWEAIGEDKQVQATIALSDASSLVHGVRTLVNFVGMHPLGRSMQPEARPGEIHEVCLSGVFNGGIQCLMQCKMVFDPSRGCLIKMNIRSEKPQVADLIAHALS